MDWELLEFTLEEVSGPVQVFNFEAALGSGTAQALSIRGDGIYMTRTRQLRINRETELTSLVSECVLEGQSGFVTKAQESETEQEVAMLVAGLTETILQRITAQPAVKLLQPAIQLKGGSPAPMMGSVAYYLEGKV